MTGHRVLVIRRRTLIVQSQSFLVPSLSLMPLARRLTRPTHAPFPLLILILTLTLARDLVLALGLLLRRRGRHLRTHLLDVDLIGELDLVLQRVEAERKEQFERGHVEHVMRGRTRPGRRRELLMVVAIDDVGDADPVAPLPHQQCIAFVIGEHADGNVVRIHVLDQLSFRPDHISNALSLSLFLCDSPAHLADLLQSPLVDLHPITAKVPTVDRQLEPLPLLRRENNPHHPVQAHRLGHLLLHHHHRLRQVIRDRPYHRVIRLHPIRLPSFVPSCSPTRPIRSRLVVLVLEVARPGAGVEHEVDETEELVLEGGGEREDFAPCRSPSVEIAMDRSEEVPCGVGVRVRVVPPGVEQNFGETMEDIVIMGECDPIPFGLIVVNIPSHERCPRKHVKSGLSHVSGPALALGPAPAPAPSPAAAAAGAAVDQVESGRVMGMQSSGQRCGGECARHHMGGV